MRIFGQRNNYIKLQSIIWKIYKNAMKSALIDQKVEPTNKKEVQAFMGFMNYFRPYILNFADIAHRYMN